MNRNLRNRADSGKRPLRTTDRLIIGIDPGLGTTGYGVLEVKNDSAIVLEAGVIRSHRNNPLELRLAEIFDGLREVFREYKPAVVVIEDLYSHYRHPKTAIIMGHARGAALLCAASLNIPVKSYGATQVKKALTGNGRASKVQMQKMTRLRLELKKTPEPPDVADALAVALCHFNHLAANGGRAR